MGPVGSCVVCLVCDSGLNNIINNLSAFRWISAYLYYKMHGQTRFQYPYVISEFFTNIRVNNEYAS
jgi:hypothetical protein